jgi:uncharacterized protein DUF3152
MSRRAELRTRRRGTRAGALVAALLAVLVCSGCSQFGSSSAEPVALGLPPAGRSPAVAVPAPAVPTTPVPTATAFPTPAVRSAATQAAAQRLALDRLAGVRSSTLAWNGTGKLRVVPGQSPAPGKGRVYRIRIEVESGLNIDRAAFANYVMSTLNDKRSWTENGRRRFARTDGTADIRVVLASPATSAAICLPLRTAGKLSCRHGDSAVLTMYRWVKAIPEYSGNHDGYRHYVINHEVGHALGHAHEYCAGKGRRAPVMMQQTKGLQGCLPNPWPHP